MTVASAANGPPLPRFGEASLADVLPSVLTALDVAGVANPLAIEPVRRACVLLVDGLGWELLRAHPKDAPFLNELAERGRPITTAFPATTATSIATLGTGVPPGEHGLVGYTFAVPGHHRAMNVLQWELYGSGPRVDLRQEFKPETAQPVTTAYERAAADGVVVSALGAPEHVRSGLTRAALRGARYRDMYSLGDMVGETLAALTAGPRTLVSSYHSQLDATGHVRGITSEGWRLHLSQVDHAVRQLAERLPRDAALVVTGDHGMVNLTPDERVDVDEHPELLMGVRFLGGEARARHVYTDPGAAGDVLAAWRSVLGDRMWIVPREQAIAEGWFGPRVDDAVRSRLGDVIAAAFGPVGVMQRSVDSRQAEFWGHHGSVTAEEQLVPFIEFRQ